MSNAMSILRSASSVERASVQVAVGWIQTPTGKEREVYASVSLRKLTDAEQADMNRDERQTALKVLATMPKVALKLPDASKGATLRVKLSRFMPGDVCAVLFAHIGGWDVPSNVTAERVAFAYEQGGVNVPTPEPKRSRKGKGADVPATEPTPEPSVNGVPATV